MIDGETKGAEAAGLKVEVRTMNTEELEAEENKRRRRLEFEAASATEAPLAPAPPVEAPTSAPELLAPQGKRKGSGKGR